MQSRRDLFNGVGFTFFGVSTDPRDESEGRVAQSLPGARYFRDFDGTVGRLYGSIPIGAKPGEPVPARRFWVVLDPTLRVLQLVPFSEDGSHVVRLFSFLDSLPSPARFAGIELMAPVLYLPNVFEPELCQRLIREYEAHGGEESGFMRGITGKT